MGGGAGSDFTIRTALITMQALTTATTSKVLRTFPHTVSEQRCLGGGTCNREQRSVSGRVCMPKATKPCAVGMCS